MRKAQARVWPRREEYGMYNSSEPKETVGCDKINHPFVKAETPNPESETQAVTR
jgi:hypothetical protein